MTQQLLDGTQVGSGLQHVGRERVTKRVRGERATRAGGSQVTCEDPSYGVR